MMLGMEDVLCELNEDINEQGLPPGFRFHPTDEELITFYLASKVFHGTFCGVDIAEVDLNRCEPWELPDVAKMGEREWYFFSLRDRKYPTGLRTNRATGAGYWKATGKDREVYSSGSSGALLGMKKTLVFYKGRAPRGEKTKWVMHEYRLDGDFSYRHTCKEEWVICRIFHKLGEKKNINPLFQCQSYHHHHLFEAAASSSSPTTAAGGSLPPLLEAAAPKESHKSHNTNNPIQALQNTYDLIHDHHHHHNYREEGDLKTLINPFSSHSHAFPINAIQPNTTSFPPTPNNNKDTNTNNSSASLSPSMLFSFKTLLSHQPTAAATTTISKPCKTEANFSALFQPPDDDAHLRWWADKIHYDYANSLFLGMDYGLTGGLSSSSAGSAAVPDITTTVSVTTADVSMAFNRAGNKMLVDDSTPSIIESVTGESSCWPLDL